MLKLKILLVIPDLNFQLAMQVLCHDLKVYFLGMNGTITLIQSLVIRVLSVEELSLHLQLIF